MSDRALNERLGEWGMHKSTPELQTANMSWLIGCFEVRGRLDTFTFDKLLIWYIKSRDSLFGENLDKCYKMAASYTVHYKGNKTASILSCGFLPCPKHWSCIIYTSLFPQAGTLHLASRWIIQYWVSGLAVTGNFNCSPIFFFFLSVKVPMLLICSFPTQYKQLPTEPAWHFSVYHGLGYTVNANFLTPNKRMGKKN